MSGKIAYVFPGQGSQSVGMGFSFSKNFSDFDLIFQETLREADATIGFSLSQIIREGPVERLKETAITQPALLTVSTAMGRWLKSKGFKADYCLGHSLGEYSALVHAESLSFQDAIKLVHLRGQLMENAVPSGVGGMAALIGADLKSAQNLCQEVTTQLKDKILEPSVLNGPGQVVVSGHIEAIDLAVKLCRDFGIRMGKKLEVSGPFHCSLLQSAGTKLRLALEQAKITTPQIPVVSNTTAQLENSADEICQNLTQQVSKTVRWEESIRWAEAQSVCRYIEVGSGNVLSGLIKKISEPAQTLSLESIESLDSLRTFH